MIPGFLHRFLSRGDRWIPDLRQFRPFQEMGRRELRTVAGILERQVYGQGELIFAQGEPGATMFFVLSGRVEVEQEQADGGKAVLAVIGPGNTFGEKAMLSDEPRTASASAAEETELATLSRSDLMGLVKRDPRAATKIAMSLSRIAADWLRRTNTALREAREEVEAAQREARAGSEYGRSE